MRLIFAGTPDFAASHLKALIQDGRHEIVAVYSQPDRPAGRGKKLQASPVKQLAIAHDLPVYQPLNFKTEDAVSELKSHQADLMIVVAYGLILPQVVLDAPRLGCVNVHASLLPRWRGAAPIQRAIEAGDLETGITIMQMDAGLDTGDMLLKTTCPINSDDTAASLHDKLAEQGGPALIDAVNHLAAGTLQGEQQNDALSCYAPKILKDEALINWAEDAVLLHRKIRAFNPFPVSYTQLGDERLKIQRATLATGEGAPGEILAASKDGIQVACGKGSLLLTELQLPGARAMSAQDMLNARADRFTPGTVLGENAGEAHA
ncbi:methionyl-tRNA formyltransferase [Litorivivens lipolytica]|uniref:methionyl-tRNA formyltransferase n=1 Tax=Litorivivens lipolytica TaxID=1524264 RepID=UPI00160DAC85|nr:methionyl-tRNA formyltransferase [Litorivivens lipolytica]